MVRNYLVRWGVVAAPGRLEAGGPILGLRCDPLPLTQHI